MKQKYLFNFFLFAHFTLLVTGLLSCNNHKPGKNDFPALPEILDAFVFAEGSYWIYQNQRTLQYDTLRLYQGVARYKTEATSFSSDADLNTYYQYHGMFRRANGTHIVYSYTSYYRLIYGKFRHIVTRNVSDSASSLIESIYISGYNVGDSLPVIGGVPGGYVQVYKIANGFLLPNGWQSGKTLYIKNTHSFSGGDYYSVWLYGFGMVEFTEKGDVYKLVDYKIVKV